MRQACALEDVKVMFRQMPTFASSLHFGSRIAFSQDGKLFLTLGERALPAGMVQSQDLDSHFGKVVRLNPDGIAFPQDNPFAGRSGAKPEIWSYGHRNVQAATIDSATGKLWTIEHGPTRRRRTEPAAAGRELRLAGDHLRHQLQRPQGGRRHHRSRQAWSSRCITGIRSSRLRE